MQVGMYLQRSIAMMAMLCGVVLFVWIQTERMLLWAGQEPEICALAKRYAMAYFPGLWPSLCFECMKRYLQAQGDTTTPLRVMIIGALAHPVISYIYVHTLGLGYDGAPAAMATTGFLLPTMLIIEIRRRKLHVETWGGWSLEMFRGWPAFLKLGAPGVLVRFPRRSRCMLWHGLTNCCYCGACMASDDCLRVVVF